MELYQCPLTNDEKLHMISEAAYYRSEHRDTLDADPIDDWVTAVNEFEQAYDQQCTQKSEEVQQSFLDKARSTIVRLIEKAGETYSNDANELKYFWY